MFDMTCFALRKDNDEKGRMDGSGDHASKSYVVSCAGICFEPLRTWARRLATPRQGFASLLYWAT
jgi:hypothetical protein